MAEQKRDYYEVLGVDKNADDAAIKKAYRVLAKKYHPDNYIASPLEEVANEKMAEINDAYEFIRDSEVRNKQILDDIKHCIEEGRTPVVLTKYTKHASVIYQCAKEYADKVLILSDIRRIEKK